MTETPELDIDDVLEQDLPDEAARMDFGEEVNCPVCKERADFAVSFGAEQAPFGGKLELTACFAGGQMFVHDAPMEFGHENPLFAYWHSGNVSRDKEYDGYMAVER